MDLNDATDKLHKSQCWDIFQDLYYGGLSVEDAACHADWYFQDLQGKTWKTLKKVKIESVSHWGLQ